MFWYSDGTVKSEHYILTKEGFSPVRIRKIFGEWEMLAYVNSRLDTRWMKLTMPETDILENIRLYGERVI